MAVYDRTSIFVEIRRGGWFAASHGYPLDLPIDVMGVLPMRLKSGALPKASGLG